LRFSRATNRRTAVLAELEKLGATAVAIPLDVTRRAELEPAMAEVERALGPISILVNNAGIAVQTSAVKHDAQSWDRVIETNLNSCFFLAQIAARSMMQHMRGKIINIASEYSHFGSGSVVSYSTAKGGLVQMTKSLAIDWARYNIQVNAIVPGWIKTDMTAAAQSGPFFDEIITRTPAGRFGEPEEMAGTAIFLASHASDFVTGAIINADGGFAIR